ncbi:MAG: AmmeMemoRadiSam system protein A [Lachnospiraceae bacterium]|nr:AmmeMemoRadiSam system protein A [Lachnospiraceae bacterium]
MPILSAYMVPHPPMIIPEVGKGSEAQIEETTRAYRQIAQEIAAQRPQTIIISSPHSIMYADYFHISPGRGAKGSFAAFRARSVSFTETYDTELVRAICEQAGKRELPAGTLGERDASLDHGTMVPLYFLEEAYRLAGIPKDYQIVRIGLSGLPLTRHYELGMAIQEAVRQTGRRAVYIASGDLSHKLQNYGPYGYAPEGPEYDERIMDVCGRAAFSELFSFDETFCDKAAECGHRSFVIMAGALDGISVRAEKLSHQDVTGVGYGICIFRPGQEDESRHFLTQYLQEQEQALAARRGQEDALVRLARQTVEHYVREGSSITAPDWVTEEMKTGRAGVFVSLHEHGRLRGCIGTIQPVRSCIADEIIHNAVSAATEDPRFDPVRPEELKYLDISVDVLTKPEKINGPEDLDVKRYGIIVSCGRRRGLLLPDLDGVDTVEEQIAIARRKGGISEREPVVLERFEVIRHH